MNVYSDDMFSDGGFQDFNNNNMLGLDGYSSGEEERDVKEVKESESTSCLSSSASLTAFNQTSSILRDQKTVNDGNQCTFALFSTPGALQY